MGRIVRYCIDNDKPLTSLTLQEWQESIPEVKGDLIPLLSPKRSMERRNTLGGTSPSQVRAQIENTSVRLMMFDKEAKEFRERIPEGY